MNIVVGIATTNTRKDTLQEVIKSLKNQTIKPNKIIIYNNDENKFNASTNGKFYGLNYADNNTYYFTCDDDIIYPRTYIENTINAINKYNCIVTYHGRILRGKGLNYFTGHTTFNFTSKVYNDTKIDIPGTGVMAFHTSYFNPLHLFNNDIKRCSDVLIAIEAAKLNKDIYVLKHEENTFKSICKDNDTCTKSEYINPTNRNKLTDELYDIKYNKKLSVCIVTCLYKRHNIFKIFANNILDIIKQNNDIDFKVIVAGSEGNISKELVEQYNFIYTEQPNYTLGNKFNQTTLIAKQFNPDYILLVGSDDIIDPKIFKIYKPEMINKIDFLGLLDFYFYNTLTDETIYWGGYNNHRKGETIGAFRLLSFNLMNKLNWKPWDEKLNKGLDGSMMRKLLNFKYTKKTFKINDFNIIAVDIKNEHNLTKFKNYVNSKLIYNNKIKNFISKYE